MPGSKRSFDGVVRAVDTDILVRLLVADDPDQTASPRSVIGPSSIFACKIVLVEFEWVLRSTYGYSRAAIGGAIDVLLATAYVGMEDVGAVRRAFGWFEHGRDFADVLPLATKPSVFAPLDRIKACVPP